MVTGMMVQLTDLAGPNEITVVTRRPPSGGVGPAARLVLAAAIGVMAALDVLLFALVLTNG